MKRNGFGRWCPLAGVLALGIFTFAWSFQGAGGQELGEVAAGSPATAGGSTSRHPGSDSATHGGRLAGDRGADGRVDRGTRGVPARGARVVAPARKLDLAEAGHERIRGQRPVGRTARGRQTECLCDLDCSDGDPCTNDWCDIGDGKQIIGECVQDFVGTGSRECDDGDVSGTEGYCTLGLCDGAQPSPAGCQADLGGSPCTGDDICDEVDDRCEHPGCQAPPQDPPCDDGVYCNGAETCDAEDQCVRGEDPCPGALCDEETDQCGDPVLGRCCWGDNGYENCDESMNLDECDTQGGRWEYEGHCDCPKYSSGWAPPGTFPYDLGPIENQPCEGYYRLGDDYATANGDYLDLEEFKFVGGVDCVDDGRVLFEFWDNSSPPIKLDEIRVDFACPDDGGVHMWTVTLDRSFVIPPFGYVTLKMREHSEETGHWVSTNEVDLGWNTATQLWVNDVRGMHLWPDAPDVLAFELFGTKNIDPYKACCYADGDCQNRLPWVCWTEGGNTVEDATCEDSPDPCAKGACCLSNGTCCDDSNDEYGDPDYNWHCRGHTASETACEDAPGAQWRGHGTDCDPNCCLQAFTGGDDCHTAIVHEISVPAFGAPAVEITISGDNTPTTSGACDPATNDPGWYEAFDLVEYPCGLPAQCARVTIDQCCTDPEREANHLFLMEGCSEQLDNCGIAIFSDDHGWGPFCGGDDDNMWNIWENLPGGVYHYPVLSNDIEYPGCLGPYQVHITVEACYEYACCLPPEPGCPSHFVEMNRLACEEAGGWLLTDTPVCIDAAPAAYTCEYGACCLPNGECEDGPDYDECEECEALGGDFVGGAHCDDDPFPCRAFEACCLPNGECVDKPHMTYCVEHGGDPQGPGTACETTACPLLKWVQAPTLNPESEHPECYSGWGEWSVFGWPEYAPIAADDWMCETEKPVTAIHWWGSYWGWDGDAPPSGIDVVPNQFRIAV